MSRHNKYRVFFEAFETYDVYAHTEEEATEIAKGSARDDSPLLVHTMTRQIGEVGRPIAVLKDNDVEES